MIKTTAHSVSELGFGGEILISATALICSLEPDLIYGAWTISRHIFNLRTGQNGFSKTAIAHFEEIKLIHLNQNLEHCHRSSKMPKKWVEKNLKNL